MRKNYAEIVNEIIPDKVAGLIAHRSLDENGDDVFTVYQDGISIGAYTSVLK